MANVKNGSFRESIIDRCLQGRRGYSTQEIFDKCNDALERRGEQPISALNTIRNDILSIENRWHIVVEQIRSGREIRYEEEIAQLSQSVSMLRRFEGMPGFEWVEEMSAHLQETVSTSPEPVIGFDENKELKGMSFFTPLFKAITEKKAIKIKYHSYRSDRGIDGVIHPYYLKENNQRWFLFALNNEYKNLSIYALDRIEAVGKSSAKFIPNTDIDFSHYFDNVIGVSVKSDESPQIVKIWVDREQLPYTLSKPLHKSQNVIEENEDGSAIITIEVIPNFELEQLLLSFGERFEILSPPSLRDRISARIKKNLEKYQ